MTLKSMQVPSVEWFKKENKKVVLITLGYTIVIFLLGFFACDLLELFGDFDIAQCRSCVEPN